MTSPTLAGCLVFASILLVGPMSVFRTSSSSSSSSSSSTTIISVVFASAWTAEWIPLSKNVNKVTPPRSGHVSFSVDDKIYVFGGYVEETSQNRYPSNDLWVLRGSTNEGDGTIGFGKGWMKVLEQSDPRKDIPRKRLAAAAVKVSDPSRSPTTSEIGVLLGGWDSGKAGTGGEILNDIWTYMGSSGSSDTCDGTGIWEESNIDLGQPTSRLCAVTLDDKKTVVVHNHRCIDDVMVLDFSDKESVTLEKQLTNGRSPSPRGLHVMTRLSGENANKIVLFGGAAQSGAMSNEVFILDCEKWEWTPVEMIVDGTQADKHSPSPRASPCFVTLDDTTCLLFGGASVPEEGGLYGCNDTWLLEIDFNSEKGDKVTAKWTCVFEDDVNSDKSPPGRNAATLIAVSPESASELLSSSRKEDTGSNGSSMYFLLHGGWFPFRKTYNEDFILRVKKET